MGGHSSRKRQPLGGLPDVIAPGLRVLFVGINPGLRSAALGHHYAGHANRFWRLLHDARLVPERLTWRDDARIVEWGFGLTNLALRPTRGVGDLEAADFAAGRARLLMKLRRWRPGVVALVGVTVARQLFPERRAVSIGYQPDLLAGVPSVVVPNPSGRNAHYSYAEMLAAFRVLAEPPAGLGVAPTGSRAEWWGHGDRIAPE